MVHGTLPFEAKQSTSRVEDEAAPTLVMSITHDHLRLSNIEPVEVHGQTMVVLFMVLANFVVILFDTFIVLVFIYYDLREILPIGWFGF